MVQGCSGGDGQPDTRILVDNVSGDGQLPSGMMRHQPRDPSAPARVDRMPVMIEDPSQIAKTRERYQKKIDQLYQQAMKQVNEGGYLFGEHLRAVEARPQKAKEDLVALMVDPSVLAKTRLKAAEVLMRLNIDRGWAFHLQCLTDPNVELRLAALKSLAAYQIRPEQLQGEQAKLVVNLLDDKDPRVVVAAAELCQKSNVTGSEVKLRQLLKSGQAKDPAKLAACLAGVASTKESVDALLPHVLKKTVDGYQWGSVYNLEGLLKNPDPEISEPVRQAIYTYTLKFPEEKYDQTLVRDLTQVAGSQSKDLLLDIQKNATDPASQLYATEALARLDPDNAVDILLTQLAKGKFASDLIGEMANYATPDDYAKITQQLLAMKSPWDSRVVLLCYEKLGSQGKQFVEQNADRLDPHAQEVAYWKSQNLDLRTALNDFYAAGILPKTPDEILALMKQPKRNQTTASEIDFNDPGELLGALGWAEIVTMFDSETGMIPSNHDELLADWGAATGGKWKPECPVQNWLQESSEDFNAPYIVEFLSGDRLYRVGAENYGDWYDVEAVLRLANFSLKKMGKPEQFIPLESDGQFMMLVFADPAKFIPLAKKYRMPLSEDAAQGMKKGKDFEQRVLEQID